MDYSFHSSAGPTAVNGDVQNGDIDCGDEYELMTIDKIINGKVSYTLPVVKISLSAICSSFLI